MSGESDESDRFEDVDWAALESTGAALAPRTAVVLVGALGIVAIVGYETLLATGAGPTVAWPVAYRATPLDGLFALTMLVVLAYGIHPLYDNPRLTRRYWATFRRNRAAVWSLWFLAVVFGLGLAGPMLLAKPELNVAAGYQPPVYTAVPTTVSGTCVGPVVDGMCRGTWRHPLGTTGRGKDVLVSVIYGMRVSLQVGLITTLIIVLLGTTVGTVAAYSGGLVDEALMRYVDVQLTFPTFFLYLLLLYLFGGTLFLLIVIFGLTSWGGTARLVRSEALQRREEGYVRAARSSGAGTAWIVRRHVVPNVSNTVVTNASLLVPSLILFEATFSFLGLGDPTVPSWGQVIAAGRGDLATAWWISTIPGVFLFLTVLALNFVGDALRDALDPRAAS